MTSPMNIQHNFLPRQYRETSLPSINHNYLPQQFADYKEIFKKIERLVQGGDYTLGEDVNEFEQKICSLTGAKYCMGVGSGTDALFLSLKAVGITYGDEVITTPYTFFATIGAIVAVGAKPVFVDIDEDYNINPSLIEAAITGKTKAILPVHWSGIPCKMDQIMAIAEKHRLKVIEDSCHAINGKYKGKSPGTFGEAGCFSMHPLKNINVWGDGGFIITNNKEIHDKLVLLRNHGLINRDECVMYAYNSRLDSIQAIVANHLLQKIDLITNVRIDNAHFFDQNLAEISQISIPTRDPDSKIVFHIYVIKAERREELKTFLVENGIDAKVHYPLPMHLQPASKIYGYKKGDFPVAEETCDSVISLPVHEFITRPQQKYIVEKIKEFYQKAENNHLKNNLVEHQRIEKKLPSTSNEVIPEKKSNYENTKNSEIKIPFVNLGIQYANIRTEIISKFDELSYQGAYILTEELQKFEGNFASYCETKYAVGVANCTDALILCLKALGISSGDEVITAPNSFIATAGAICAVGATPVFVDVADDYNLNPALIEQAITAKTKAIIPVHLTGRPAAMDEIISIANKQGIAVIEDCAQAVGALYKSRKVGSLGKAGCFSLHPLKNLHVHGDGGVITTNDPEFYTLLCKLRNHGLKNRDECEHWGLNSRLDVIQAAIANVKLSHLDSWNQRYREIASLYRAGLSGIVKVPLDQEYEKPVYHNFIFLSDDRDKLQKYLLERGIETKIHYPIPIHLQPAAVHLKYKKSDFPVAEYQAERILSLPIYPELTNEQVNVVITAIKEFYQFQKS